MASSSRKCCFQCEDSSSNQLRNGWRLRSGQFAQLCHRCSSLYEEGTFCETFHSTDDGWRDCESCGKLVHCGCIVSFNAYMLLDCGGVFCIECSKIKFILARRLGLSFETQLGNREPEGVSSRQIHIEPDYRPHVTAAEREQISRNQKFAVVPLFEKLLSASDADVRLARLLIPKKCAETFFPNISEPHGIPIKILDMEGKEWEFNFRYWLKCGSRTYILEGLKDYMNSIKWQAGDIVTFHRMEPEGKLIIGLRKDFALPSQHENSA